ncbi:MAG: hypothetical protein WAX48_19520, partial [Desulfosalsimonadaceae bacterium]
APHGARRFPAPERAPVDAFQSTRPARGATANKTLKDPVKIVSIHAPRTGRDHQKHRSSLKVVVSIHAPRTGRDAADWAAEHVYALFQSTRPARGATVIAGTYSNSSKSSFFFANVQFFL